VSASRAEPWTILRLMLWSAAYLQEKGVERARLDAEYLLAHVLGLGRLQMYLQHERPLTDEELDSFRPLLRRRAAREPLQYILGRQAFRHLELEVEPGVLIPRPETEQLVEIVLEWSRAQGRDDLVGLDIGTGSGAIALALASEGPFARVVATDASTAALAVARRNRDALGLETRVDLRHGSDFDPVAPHAIGDGVARQGLSGVHEAFDVVVSNPPYVDELQKATLAPEIVEWEPHEALFAGPDGLSVLHSIVSGAPSVLGEGGLLALEVGLGQAEIVATLARRSGAYADVSIHRDLAGKERIVTATRSFQI
jgi:release factor glutamine methyltransferase